VLSALFVTYLGLVAFVMPALDRKKVAADMGLWVVEHRQKDAVPARVATYYFLNPAFRFYVDQSVTFLDDPAQARAFFNGLEPFYCLMRKAAFDQFVAEGVPLRIVHEREGMSVTSGRALWRSHLPETRFVLATRDR
jgi:hypothetical protein